MKCIYKDMLVVKVMVFWDVMYCVRLKTSAAL